MRTKFWLENLKWRDHVEGLGIDGKNNIRMKLREIRREGVDWMRLAQARDQ
jgi:hypothetical protein